MRVRPTATDHRLRRRHPDVGAPVAAGARDARPRHPHQARADARRGRGRLRRRVSRLLRAPRAARPRSARPCSIRRRAWCSIRASGSASLGRTAKDAADRRGALRAHHRRDPARGCARALRRPCPRGTSSTSSTGTWSRPSCKKGGTPPPFTGEVGLVTGAASGIGKAAVDSLLARGAAVVGLDVNPAVEHLHRRDDFLGLALRRDRRRGDRRGARARGACLRRPRHAGAERGHLRREPQHQRPAAGRVAQGDGDQSRRESRAAARLPSLAQARAAGRPRGRDRLQERARARAPAPRPTPPRRPRSPSSPASPRSSGARTAYASTRCTRTRCSTPASGPRRCSPSARSNTA